LVSSYLPYPLIDGGKIRLYNLLKILSEKHEITLICEKRPNQNLNDVKEIEKVCKKLITVDRPKALSLKNVSKSLLTLNPLLTTTHDSVLMKNLIKKELNENSFNLIHVETFYVMQNVPKTNIPIILVEHNIEYQVYEKYAQNSSIITRSGLYYDIWKLKRREKQAWNRASKVIAVSPTEQKIIGPKTELVPNGVDLKKFKVTKRNNGNLKKVLFIGNFSWVQNRDSAVFIIRNIWPKIISKNSNCRLWIVGKQIPDSIKKLGEKTVIIDENAPNETELIFQEANVLLAPIRVGGGSNFKILEAMACGTPVITSSLGNEGIEASEGSEILIANNPEEYAKAVVGIINDNYLYEKISRNSRKFIEDNFDWNKIAIKLDSIYRKAALI